MDEALGRWLLEGDPAVRWQALEVAGRMITVRALRVLRWWEALSG